MRLCLGVLEGDGDAAAAETSVVRSREHIMSIVADPENFVVCDFSRGFAFGWVTESTAADHPLLRYQFLVAGRRHAGGSQRAFAPLHGASGSAKRDWRDAGGRFLRGQKHIGLCLRAARLDIRE